MFKIKPIFSYLLMSLFFLSSMASGQGLQEATDAITTFQTWLYTILGVAVLVYMIYQIMLAMADKQPWADVVVAVGKVAAAGGSVTLATWAWGIWGA